MSNWSPKPLRPMGVDGIFSYESDVVVKSETPNRWVQQRNEDGTPHTKHGASALTPPPAGPQLRLNDLEKSKKESKNEEPAEVIDPDKIVKSYLEKSGMMGAMKQGVAAGKAAAGKVTQAANQAHSTLSSAGATAKACDVTDKDADEIAKGGLAAATAILKSMNKRG